MRIPDLGIALGIDSPRPANRIIFTVHDTGSAVKGRHIDIFAGLGDQGREIAEKINDLQKRKFVIEVVGYQP
ncbi:MAG TPA: hypothetical protein DEB07_03045 [Candidatus Moranbacteria bacterium]|nr:hypothetical protein [Candidatus Moranbacteria bacterium]HBU25188.1 hypothetical protein [Candidatus Moranbacteria bacterium]